MAALLTKAGGRVDVGSAQHRDCRCGQSHGGDQGNHRGIDRRVVYGDAVKLGGQELREQVCAGVFEQRSWRWPPAGGVARARVLAQLRSLGGKHLVFVRYGVRHDLGDEWVFNDADIDASQVVWARGLDRDGNAELIGYFAGRRVWLVEPDDPFPLAVPCGDAPVRPMRFVQLGAPGIAVLRSVDRMRSKVLAQPGASGDGLLTCDTWNFLFGQATGVAGPDVSEGCYTGSDRAKLVSFEHWFSWLRVQR